mgnify:CR=1 FL=1
MNNVLPLDFVSSMQQLLGVEEYERFAASMQCEPMVSVRLNPWRKAVSSFPLEIPEIGRASCRERVCHRV